MLDQPELSPFAEELIPEAFARPHTAFRVHRVDAPLSGEPGFAQFVEERLRYTLTHQCDCGVFPARMVVVEGGDDVAWYWDDDVGCPVSWTIERVRREARPIPEPWLFAIELLRPEAPAIYWEEQPDGDLLALPNPSWQDLTWPAIWYAEARGRGMAHTEAGIVRLEHAPLEGVDRVLRRLPIAPASNPMTRDFHRILYGHPARKAHPLRRSRRIRTCYSMSILRRLV